VSPDVVQFAQSAPPVPQAVSIAPELQTPLVSQQPLQFAQLDPQTPPSSTGVCPTLHVPPTLVQSVHDAPWVPQAVSAPPMLQMLFAQQPVHHVEQLSPLSLEPPLLLEPPLGEPLLEPPPTEPLLDPPLDVPFPPLDVPFPPLDAPPPLLELASSPIGPAPPASYDASERSSGTDTLPPQADAPSATSAKTHNGATRQKPSSLDPVLTRGSGLAMGLRMPVPPPAASRGRKRTKPRRTHPEAHRRHDLPETNRHTRASTAEAR
jgi:hypothetical protein